MRDTAWTFLNGVNHYHPYWEETARQPSLGAGQAAKPQVAVKSHRAGV
jgi:hypothetical protein